MLCCDIIEHVDSPIELVGLALPGCACQSVGLWSSTINEAGFEGSDLRALQGARVGPH